MLFYSNVVRLIVISLNKQNFSDILLQKRALTGDTKPASHAEMRKHG